MDILSEIQDKLQLLKGHSSIGGIQAAVRHIEVAERWLARARTDGDEDHYNDVIYRTNQAFEGMLKEAYVTLTGQSAESLSTHQIEQKLLEEEVLTDRVRQLFTNYRREWRNKSTHDHRLFFKGQEALLAIVSVTAFTTILIDQIIEAASFQSEKRLLAEQQVQRSPAPSQASTPLYERISTALLAFSGSEESLSDVSSYYAEMQLLGRVGAFIEASILGARFIREPKTIRVTGSRPDAIVQLDDEAVIVETRIAIRGDAVPVAIERGTYALSQFLDATAMQHAVLFVPPQQRSQPMTVSAIEGTGHTEGWMVHVVAPVTA